MFDTRRLTTSPTAAVLGALGLVLATAADAGPISTYLGGIGVNVPDATSQANSASAAWAPAAGSGVLFSAEDSVGSGGYVGPGYGGQPYDLEALYVQRTATQLIITGLSGAALSAMPSGASGSCAPGQPCYTFGIGDFFIGTGTPGAFTPLFGIETTGQHYTMHSTTGHTTGWNSPLAAGELVGVNPVTHAGYERGLAAWSYVGAPSQLAMGGWSGPLGNASMGTPETIAGHAAFQATLDLSLLGSMASQDLLVHWGEICGNDFLRTPVTTAVPEPSTIALLGLGLLGLGAARSRARRRVA